MGWIKTDSLLPALINVNNVTKIYTQRETGEEYYHIYVHAHRNTYMIASELSEQEAIERIAQIERWLASGAEGVFRI